MSKLFWIACIVGVVSMLGFSPRTEAASVPTILYDFDHLTVQAKNAPGGFNIPFRARFNGFLQFGLAGGMNATSLDIYQNDVLNTDYMGTITGVSGGLTVVGGVITGGTITFAITNPDTSVDTFNFVVTTSSNTIQDFGVLGLGATGESDYSIVDDATADGLFGEANLGKFFAEVPDSMFSEWLLFDFNPNMSGFDGSVSLDVSAAIPTPAAYAMGTMLLVMLGAGKYWVSRRRTATLVDSDDAA